MWWDLLTIFLASSLNRFAITLETSGIGDPVFSLSSWYRFESFVLQFLVLLGEVTWCECVSGEGQNAVDALWVLFVRPFFTFRSPCAYRNWIILKFCNS